MQLGGRSFHSSGIVRYIFDSFTWVRIMTTYFSCRTCTKRNSYMFFKTKTWVQQSFFQPHVDFLALLEAGLLRSWRWKSFVEESWRLLGWWIWWGNSKVQRDFQVIHRSKARWNVEDSSLGDIGYGLCEGLLKVFFIRHLEEVDS